MADILYDLLFNQKGKKNIIEEYKNKTRFELTLTESNQTKKDNKVMRTRKTIYEGKEIDITPHVKYGNKEPDILRVHFCADHESKKIVIGHCGDHLNTAGTRRR